MNIALYNQLMNAKACLKKNEEYNNLIVQTRRKIDSNKHFLDTCKTVEDYRRLKKEPFLDKAGRFFSKHAFPEFEGCLSSIIHYIYIFPFVAFFALLFYVLYGICYLIGYPFFKSKEEIENKKYKAEYEASIQNTKKRNSFVRKLYNKTATREKSF